ncbi:FAD-dependent oxidoreductase [Streptomyces sp. URMC 123]|uniref:FAD-dependent oxidoreductase n=1 Tax=Streptomyces sp. URMC 123 TaxID=3423403 RepID=UPI003F1B3820
MRRILVIGNGPAAHRFVDRLRHHGHHDPVTVLGAEERPAYHRVLLPAVLSGTLPPTALSLPPLPEGTDVRLGVTVTAIDRARRLVHGDPRGPHPYDVLVLATGARPNLPFLPGLLTPEGRLAEGVRTVRELGDRPPLPDGPLTVLGGGVLGVEVAHALLAAGRDVTLVHPKAHPMERQLDAPAGRLLVEHLERLGLTLLLGHRAVDYRPGRLTLDDGRVVRTGTLLVCTGVTPAADLARRAGLAVRRGVLVDDELRTDDPAVHAIGDCAEHAGTVAGRVGPAWEQAEALARLLAGRPARYTGGRPVTRLRATGLDVVSLGRLRDLTDPAAAVELVTLADPARGRYARLALRRGRVGAAVLVGFPQAIATVTHLYDHDLPVPADRLALLLGTAVDWGADGTALPDDAVICHCNHVTKGDIVAACRAGAHDLAALARATRATTGCGSCANEVRCVAAEVPAPTRELART